MAKYVIIIPDGAADKPLDMFGGLTPLEAATIPHMDSISIEGRQGLVRTVPDDFEPGSDVAQMSLLGYDPRQYYTGRASLEAAAQNIKLGLEDWVFRCNLITIADNKMADHSAGHISSEEASQLITQLARELEDERLTFYPGVSYRHLLVCKGMDFNVQTCPPHDYIGTPIDKLLPRGKGADLLRDLMFRSMKFFEKHDINKVRNDLGENPVSSIWLWGQGKQARMDSFYKRFGVKGAAITAVDLVRGLAKLIGYHLIHVPGATGFADTNYAGKGQAAIEGLKDYDLIFVHIEAPDEASHEGNAALKKETLEKIDQYIVGPVYEVLKQYDQWRILVMPDHPTPVSTKAHDARPVPFAMAGTDVSGVLHESFGESHALKTGFLIENGHDLMEYFLKI